MKAIIEAARALLEYVDAYHPLDGSPAQQDVTAALRNAIHIWDKRTQFSPELLDAIREASTNGQAVTLTPSGAVAFINDGSEPDYSHLNCPACGGSGHIGDASGGIGRIAAERRRQIEKEGWTAEHDDAHRPGSLAAAAACYALPHDCEIRVDAMAWNSAPAQWPWARTWWKPAPIERLERNVYQPSTEGRIRELEKAGALIAAEIDRLQRSGNSFNERNQ